MIPVEKVRDAAKAIFGKVIKTPLVYSPTLSHMFGGEIYLKLENLQKTGSFKIRGATYKLQSMLKTIGDEGVVAASAGNHAQGVALAAHEAGIPSTIVMPEWASITKQEATRNYGGEVIIAGRGLGESLIAAQDLVKEGKTLIHPFDDPDIIVGQGTIALEILGDLYDTDMVIVPVGGGGLISGIACVLKSIRPDIRIVGVQAAACASAYESFERGTVTKVETVSSIADGIMVRQVGQITFELIQTHVDKMVLVEEAQIAASILMLLERKKILVEGAGAVSLAALLSGNVTVSPGSKVVLVISGGNVDSPLLGRIISQGLLKSGRIQRLRVRLEDIPGSLACLLADIAKTKANVLHIYHDRNVREQPINITWVELELETRGPSHAAEVVEAVRKAGYEVELR